MSRLRPSSGHRERAEVVIVTGASSGIGREVCRRFADQGASVGMIARDGERLAEAATELARPGFVAAADVARPAELADALDRIVAALGPPTVLVNGAGHGHWGAVADTDLDAFRRAVEVNYLGAVAATAHVLPGMLERGRGHIVNIGSIAGRIGVPFEAAYTASKFALVGYTEALAIEIDGSGVGASLVEPGPVDTAFFERRGHPYERRGPRPVNASRVAEAVLAAVRVERAEVFVPRWLRLAHVAKTVVPGLYRLGTRRMYAAERGELRARGVQSSIARSRSARSPGGGQSVERRSS